MKKKKSKEEGRKEELDQEQKRGYAKTAMDKKNR